MALENNESSGTAHCIGGGHGLIFLRFPGVTLSKLAAAFLFHLFEHGVLLLNCIADDKGGQKDIGHLECQFAVSDLDLDTIEVQNRLDQTGPDIVFDGKDIRLIFEPVLFVEKLSRELFINDFFAVGFQFDDI